MVRAGSSAKRLTLKERRQRELLIKGLLAFILLASVLAALAVGTRMRQFDIVNVAVEGTTLIPVADVQAVAQQKLAGTYALIVPKNFTYLAPLGAIQSELVKKYPNIKSVSITRTSGTTIAIHIAERTPAALWCAGALCYDMDEQGYVYKSDTGSALRRYTGAIDGNPIGRTFMSGAFPDFVRTLSDIEASTKHTVVAAAVKSSDVTLTLSDGGELRLTIPTSDAVIASIATVFASTAFAQGGSLEYADFRYGAKALVKFRK